MSGTKAILDQLPPSDRRLLAGKWVERRYEPHQLVIEHGDDNCDVFFLLEGRIRVTLFTETGREVAYREMGRGDIFGELAGIDGKARSASIVALEPARVARLPQAQFRDFVKGNPVFAWVLLVNGVVYVLYSIGSRHLSRDLAPDRSDWRSIGRSIRDHLRFRHPTGEEAKRYNVLQKLTYLIVIFILLPLIILMGIAMSPWMNSVLPGWVDLFGGRQAALRAGVF